ncbi:MAG: helix-turn-helix domain-containing protein [Roseiflexaceae bacterium]
MKYPTAEEIAAELRVDISTVRRWLRSGELASIRVGQLSSRANGLYGLKNREVPHQQDPDPKANDLAFAH